MNRSTSTFWMILSGTMLCAVLLASGTAGAQTLAPVLRSHVIVYSDLVTLGDLFVNAGKTAGTAVFRAPDLGTSGDVGTGRIEVAAHAHGLEWTNSGGIAKVTVMRPSKIIGVADITEAIRARLTEQFFSGQDNTTVSVKLSRGAKPIEIAANASAEIAVSSLEFDPRASALRAVITLRDDPGAKSRHVYRGQAVQTVQVPVVVRDIRRGEIITRSDLAVRDMPRRRVSRNATRDIEAIAGLAARRRLRANQPLRRSDLEKPKLVRKNTLVTIAFRAPRLVITTRGRALGNGARGDIVNVLNIQSKRIIQAVVLDKGRVAPAAGPAQEFAVSSR